MTRSLPFLALLVCLGAGWPKLSEPPEQGGGSGDAAVIVGIEDYVFLEDVAGARTNAEDWFLYLHEGRGVPLSHIHLLRDVEGADHKVLGAARAAAGEVQPGGTLWFVWIGHGAPTSGGDDGLLVGVDAASSAEGIQRRSIARSDLTEVLLSGPQEQTLILIDASFSGQGPSGQPLVAGLQPLVPTWALPPTQATVLSAARPDQHTGPLPGLDRPAFSYLALGALRGWGDTDGDGTVTSEEVVHWAGGALVATVRDRSQEPGHTGPVLELGAALEGGPDLAAIASRGATVGASSDFLSQLDAIEAGKPVEPDIQAQVDEATTTLRAEATRAWQQPKSTLKAGGLEAVVAARLFVHEWSEAKVIVDMQSWPVQVPEVEEARSWLEAHPDVGWTGNLAHTGPVLSEHGYRMIRVEPALFTLTSIAPIDVRLTYAYEIGATEVTQRLYQAVTGTNPSAHAGCPDCPVEQVTWAEAMEFCNRLSELEGLTPAYSLGEAAQYHPRPWRLDPEASGYRLPSVAEWVLAANTGSTTLIHPLDETDWYAANSGRTTHPVATRRPNPWGLYDVFGNTCEWIWPSWVHDGSGHGRGTPPVHDPLPLESTHGWCRGGSFLQNSTIDPLTFEGDTNDNLHASQYGIRIARRAPEETP